MKSIVTEIRWRYVILRPLGIILFFIFKNFSSLIIFFSQDQRLGKMFLPEGILKYIYNL